MPENKNTPDIIFLSFADNRIPEFKEVRSKEWISFGEDNKFPLQLLYLFNKSSNHNAIINGKVTYIFGNGFPIESAEKLKSVNSRGENYNKVFKKGCIDIELFGGLYFQIIWKMGGEAQVLHLPFQNLRKDKEDKGYWYRKDWSKSITKDDEPIFLPHFDPNNRQGSQIFCYKEYRPGCDHYPLPGYFGALNDIETDVEISKYNLSIMKNGQFTGKLISFYNGQPTEEKKRQLEKLWKDKFNGSENAGRTMLSFNDVNGKEPIVTDLSSTDLDKLFDQLNKTTQAEIFSGHQVTSPMLFGIMEAGKLGGRNELQDAYEIFKNTYVNDKQKSLEEISDFLLPFLGVQEKLKIDPVEPIGIILDPKDFIDILPEKWVLDKFGIDEAEYPSDNVSGVTSAPGVINDTLKGLKGREHQQLLRIVRQFTQGKITRQMASIMLKSGYGLNDDEVFEMLGAQKFSSQFSENEVAMMFEEIGEPADNYILAKRLSFDSGANLSQVDSDILDLIRKDKRVSSEIIAETIKSSKSYVDGRIKALAESGVLTEKSYKIGVDTIIEHAVNPERIDSRPRPETIDVYVKYSYRVKPGEGPAIIATTRPFCKKLIELNRVYTRAEIESISARLGYSVFDRGGGFWGDSPSCRHEWVRELVIKKR